MIKKAMKNVVERFPKVAQFYRNTRDLLDRNTPSTKTPWGFQLSGHPAMAAGTFEPAETQLVRELLHEVDILVNVGANVGYYCCHALSIKGESYRLKEKRRAGMLKNNPTEQIKQKEPETADT